VVELALFGEQDIFVQAQIWLLHQKSLRRRSMWERNIALVYRNVTGRK